jgi:thiol-disulfide isomerase/thioredoxin
MKKIILTSISLIVVFLCYFGYHGLSRKRHLQKVEFSSKRLPQKSFRNLEGSMSPIIKNNRMNTVIIYFHPECEHCQYEVQEIYKYKDSFEFTNIFMISPAQEEEIKQFNNKYKLSTIKCLSLLWDKNNEFEHYFGKTTFPTVFIYNSKNRLEKKFSGEVKIEAILKYLN